MNFRALRGVRNDAKNQLHSSLSTSVRTDAESTNALRIFLLIIFPATLPLTF
jgi:hypothetical protein